MIAATAAIRPMVNEFTVGVSTTPADTVLTISLTKVSTITTAGSSPTPTPLDSGDVASVSLGKITFSAEPTTAFTMINFAMNARATYRWVAQDGREIIPAAGAATGVGLTMVLAGASSTMTGAVIFRE